MYTVDENSAEPIMLLNRQIGRTHTEDGYWDGIEYVDGHEFAAELLRLDNMGKKRIQVWINSPGGYVTEGMSIFSAILKSKTPVDTYNVGVAASIAGAVFMAGRRRVMADYAQFMMHPVSGGTDAAALDAFKTSTITMLQSKSGLTPEMIAQLMEVTTWMGAAECFEKGICTDIEATRDGNKRYMPSGDVKAMLSYSNNILTDLLPKPRNTMVKITNKLNLAEGSNEDVILAAINRLEEARTTAENRATEVQNSLTEAEARVADLQAQLDAANTELAAAKEAEAAATEAAATQAATELVNSFTDRIGTAEEAVTKWVNLAKTDMTGTKAMLEALPLNKQAPKPSTDSKPTPVTAHGIMQDIANRTQPK